jgi:hypothetical protein
MELESYHVEYDIWALSEMVNSCFNSSALGTPLDPPHQTCKVWIPAPIVDVALPEMVAAYKVHHRHGITSVSPHLPLLWLLLQTHTRHATVASAATTFISPAAAVASVATMLISPAATTLSISLWTTSWMDNAEYDEVVDLIEDS